MDLESLGFTKEELQERVVERICENILSSVGYDEDGNSDTVQSKFAKTVEKKCRDHIDTVINQVAEKHLFPNIEKFIQDLQLQETTSWGEKRGEPVSFIGYLTQRAEAYMAEKVNFEGKDKASAGSYSWSGTQTRLTHMVHQHLHYSIKTAMENAVSHLNKAIVPALEETVKIKLGEVANAVKVTVKTA